jgi:pyruvate-ferredoxin/flavodoxin oxidoreductase
VSAFPADGTFPTGTAQYEKRNLALEIPVWDEKTASNALKCVAICPHATIRAKVYEPAARQRARRRSRAWTAACRSSRAGSSRSRWRRRIAPAARCAWTSARPKTKPRRSSRPSTCGCRRRCATPERENWNFFLNLPEWTGAKSRRPSCASSSSCSRCSNSAAPAPAAAKRPTSKCSQVVRRPRRHRQRHRLFLHLRRQPADDALRKNAEGRGPAWCNSLVRGQRGVRPRLPRLD